MSKVRKKEQMLQRMKNIEKGCCAICGSNQKHVTEYNKETGISIGFTHDFDYGNFEDFKFKQSLYKKINQPRATVGKR